jgi:exocyst complex component 7
VMTDCFLAYEILDLVTPLSYRLDSRTSGLKSQFSEALRPIRETARSSLTEIIEQTRARAVATHALPNDGSTIPLVSETCTRLIALSTFSRPVSSLLSSLGDGNWRTSLNPPSKPSLTSGHSTPSLLSIGPETENPTLLSHYLLDLVDALLTSLEARAKQLHRTRSLQGTFLANSVAVLDRSVRASTGLAMYLGIAPHSAKLDAWRRKAATAYLDAWKEISVLLLDSINTTKSTPGASSAPGARPLSGSAIDSSSIVKGLSGKEKDKKKEQFKAFNTQFDEMVARHKGLNMERDVRQQFAREVQTVVEPLYARFWDRYHEIDKGKGKVVKYDKGQLATILAGMG